MLVCEINIVVVIVVVGIAIAIVIVIVIVVIIVIAIDRRPWWNRRVSLVESWGVLGGIVGCPW